MNSSQHNKNSDFTITEMFDRIAFRYDFLNRLLSCQQDKRWRKQMVAWLPQREDGALLDVACGTGDVLLTAIRARKDYSEFVGVDISKNMLGLAEKKLLRYSQSTSIMLKKFSAEKLKFPDEKFDSVTIAFGLRNVVNKEKAIAEFFRVLKPGASLFILEFFPAPSNLVNLLFKLYFHYILPFIGGILSDRKAYTYLPKSVASFYTLHELQKRLAQIGFLSGRQKLYLWGSCVLLEVRKPIH